MAGAHNGPAAFNLSSLLDDALHMLNGHIPKSPKRGSFDRPSTMSGDQPRAWVKSLHPRRYTKLCLSVLSFLSLFGFLWSIDLLVSPAAVIRSTLGLETETAKEVKTVDSRPKPPLYEKWYEFERNLPQQDESLPYPEGANAELFYASNHVWGLGFNNALQEQLFLSHLAYKANRTFVFDTYIWNYVLEEPYTDYNGKLIPSRIPLTAFLSGPTAGGSFGKNDKAPRAVSKQYFERVCPERTLIKSTDVNDDLGTHVNASVTMEAWANKLRATPSRCVEVGNSDQIFNYMVFGDGQRILPFLEEFIGSPVLTRFAWSTLVKDAMSANEHFFTDAPKLAARPLSPIRLLDSSDDNVGASAPIPGLLAIHVRRGDFVEHCNNLASWGSEYMGWLQSPLIIDRFNKPPAAGIEQTDAIKNHYMKHCWPSIDEIVSKIDEVRWTSEGHGLKRVYVMTNGPTEWVEELKGKIMALGGWDGVATSRDLALIPEQKYIAQAVDMAIAMRSQVFIGNGFSSLSANVFILRLSQKLNGLTNRLW